MKKISRKSFLKTAAALAAGTVHTGNLRYRYLPLGRKKILCDLRSIQVYDPEREQWEKPDYNKAYSTSFTFESTQNLVGLMEDTTRKLIGKGIPFAPYDEVTRTYAQVPRDTTSEDTAAAGSGLLLNVFTDPLRGYFRNGYIFGQQYTVAQALSKIAGGVTLVNSIVSTICAVVLYLALRPALERANLLPKHKD